MKQSILTTSGRHHVGSEVRLKEFCRAIAAFVFFLLAGMIIGGCGRVTVSDKVPSLNREILEDTTHVVGMVLQRGVFSRDLISQARIEASTRSDIVFEVEGLITNIHVRTGQRVKEGEVIATIDDFELQHELEVIRMDMLEKQLSLSAKLISLGYEIADSMVIPRELWTNLRIESGIPALKLREKMAQHRLEQIIIKAPIAGVIADVVAQVGNPASNYAKLCTIIGDEELLVRFPILESELANVRVGRPVEVFPFHKPSEKYGGKVSAINPHVSEEGMITIIANLKRSEGLLDGMQVKVHLLEDLSNQLIVPKRAIVDRQNRHVSFILRQGAAHWVYSNILDENATHYALDDSGPKAGDTIIIENNFDLSHLETVLLDSIIEK